MTMQLIEFSYLVSAICFIFALKGLSSPKSARIGSYIGMIGMAIALIATFNLPAFAQKTALIITIVLGGGVGGVIAKRIPMTAMPQLVAGFHSLVGLAAVLVAFGALISPENFGIGEKGGIPVGALIEMSLGAAIGALTFSGSLIAFGKLQGLIGARPMKFVGQQYVCLLLSVM
ncbi:MAG: NAD(P)(+) transhydrogenase (Re/Si-specific) subunit beta, partial [Rickettsiaceae bacterium]|nr:NAD(P)(+) transhydrogenase (Re/Si-specific) subunit beta [Rickettsiaceae bacterium]